MEEEIQAMLYIDEDYKDSMFNRLRDGVLPFSEEEERKLIVFSKEVNCHLRNNNATATEVGICIDMLFCFMTEPELKHLYNEIFQNLIRCIDF